MCMCMVYLFFFFIVLGLSMPLKICICICICIGICVCIRICICICICIGLYICIVFVYTKPWKVLLCLLVFILFSFSSFSSSVYIMGFNYIQQIIFTMHINTVNANNIFVSIFLQFGVRVRVFSTRIHFICLLFYFILSFLFRVLSVFNIHI